MGIKASIAMYKAVLAAGFKLVNVEQMEVHDGLCWRSTLAHGKTKILEASNGGYGGMDEVSYLINPGSIREGREAAQPFIDKLYALPEVEAFIRAEMVELLNISKKYSDDQSRDFDAEIEATKTASLSRDDETIARIVGQLSDTRSIVSRLKRAEKTRLSWIEKSPEGDSDNTVGIKGGDTPANRAAVMKRYGDTIDVFVADLIQGL